MSSLNLGLSSLAGPNARVEDLISRLNRLRDELNVTFKWLIVFVCVVVSLVRYIQVRKKDVCAPTIGPSGRLTSYFGAIKALLQMKEMLEDGYRKKYPTFKLPTLNRWLIIVNTPELIDEVHKAPDDKLSFIEATEDSLAVKYTLGPLISGNHYHVALVRSQLTRNLGVLYNDILDEVSSAFEENVPAETDEWISLNVMDTALQVVGRTSNRVFVGLPLCRVKELINIGIRHAMDVVKGSLVINLFPDFMKALVGELLTAVPRTTRRAIKHLRPVIEYRIGQYEKHGRNWPDKPEENRNVRALTQRILTLNFAALHTSSLVFAQTLLYLAAHPEDVKVLREEIERFVREEGWSKASLRKMQKVDSYVKEALRMDGIGLASMGRKVLADYTLSDGTFLPAGTIVVCNASSIHKDNRFYSNAKEFNGFRFYDSASEPKAERETGSMPYSSQLISTSAEFLTFGHGRHACPGRFLAADELKTMLAYVVLKYDVKLEDGAKDRPKTLYFGLSSTPDPKARLLFRKRSASESFPVTSRDFDVK